MAAHSSNPHTCVGTPLARLTDPFFTTITCTSHRAACSAGNQTGNLSNSKVIIGAYKHIARNKTIAHSQTLSEMLAQCGKELSSRKG
eukprot:3553120-Pyramimonas_sp.AAC.1